MMNFGKFLINYGNINSWRSLLFNRTYNSSINLSSIYPETKLDITKEQQIPKTEGNKFSGYIPMEQLTISYSRSSGPGGQNVNKLNTKVDVRFHLDSAKWLTPEIKEAVQKQQRNNFNSDGFLIVRSEKTRSQQLNLADALDKLRHMIHTSVRVPMPLSQETVERHRRKHEAACRERIRQKRERSIIKRRRRGDDFE